jgi:hypothetical protein
MRPVRLAGVEGSLFPLSTLSGSLLLQANHADGNGLALALRVFRASLFGLLPRFEGF